MKKFTLAVIDGETLMDKRLPETKFCVETLLPQGLCILGGSPKVGKSWLVLDLCIHIAKGEPMWGLPVTQGETLYLCLEDSERRIQERLNTITDDVPPGLYLYSPMYLRLCSIRVTLFMLILPPRLVRTPFRFISSVISRMDAPSA